jgi:hypothetical protein
MRRRYVWVILAVSGFALAAPALWLLPRPSIPSQIRKQAAFTIFTPDSSEVEVQHESVKYDTNLKLLSYTVRLLDTHITMSEQATPDSFNDVPQAYEKVVAGMNTYERFDTILGTVYLTRPQQLAGKQAAVLNTKGTLLFAKPDNDLSADQWRQFFGVLAVIK